MMYECKVLNFSKIGMLHSKRGYLCSIVGSCLYLIWGGDSYLLGCRCTVATRDKTVVLCLRIIVLLTLHALLNAIICCLQLNTERGADAIREVDY